MYWDHSQIRNGRHYWVRPQKLLSMDGLRIRNSEFQCLFLEPMIQSLLFQGKNLGLVIYWTYHRNFPKVLWLPWPYGLGWYKFVGQTGWCTWISHSKLHVAHLPNNEAYAKFIKFQHLSIWVCWIDLVFLLLKKNIGNMWRFWKNRGSRSHRGFQY
jgi:hypothetical protein